MITISNINDFVKNLVSEEYLFSAKLGIYFHFRLIEYLNRMVIIVITVIAVVATPHGVFVVLKFLV